MRRALVLLVLLLPACGLLPRGADPDVEIARRAIIQTGGLRTGETYDALAPDLAERFRRDAERLPTSERNRKVEIIAASVVWKGEGFTEVAVIARVSNPNRPQAPPLITRDFVRVQNGKVVAIYPTLP